jgi:hypothetical protein
MDFFTYLNAVRKHWWPLMSCALFTGLGMWIFYADKSNAWALRATFGIAGFCLLWAGYRAWLEERQKRIALEKPPEIVPSLKEQTLNLSTSILEFVYARLEGTPKISSVPRFPNIDDTTAWLQKMEDYNQELRAGRAYEEATLGMYDCRYRRLVAGAVVSVKSLGLDTGALEQCASDLLNEIEPEDTGSPRVSIPIHEWIKAVGEKLGILADQINKD